MMAGDKMSTEEMQNQINKIDVDILKLLIKRNELTKSLQVKQRLPKGMIAYEPDREAMALRGVLSKNEGRLPIQGLVKIWREILSGEGQMLRPFSVAVYTKENTHEMIELAKNHFGTMAKYMPCLSVSQAIQKIDTKRAGVAILPLFEQSEDSWWTTLATGEHKALKIVAKLPFLKQEGKLGKEAYVISEVNMKPTGNDRTLFAIEMATQTSLASLKSLLEATGLTVRQVWPAYNLSRIFLFAVEFDGVVDMSDKRLQAFVKAQEKNLQLVRPIGGYAVQECV